MQRQGALFGKVSVETDASVLGGCFEVMRADRLEPRSQSQAVHIDDETRAVLLDLDDTLTDRSATVRVYAGQFAADFGAQFRLADVAVVAAEIARVDRNGYNRHRASDLARHAAWISSPGAQVLAEHWNRYFPACTQGRAGLLATVDALTRAGIGLGIVTNGQTDRQRRKIEALQLHDRLRCVLISEELGIAKPDPRIFRAAAAGLGADPSECMFIGDNPARDVLGALAVGMRAVWFRAGLRWPEGLALPRESVGSLPEILALPRLHAIS